MCSMLRSLNATFPGESAFLYRASPPMHETSGQSQQGPGIRARKDGCARDRGEVAPHSAPQARMVAREDSDGRRMVAGRSSERLRMVVGHRTGTLSTRA